MAYTFETMNKKSTTQGVQFVEVRKGQNVYDELKFLEGDVIVLKTTADKEVNVMLIGYDEKAQYLNGLVLYNEELDGELTSEVKVLLTNGKEQMFYVNSLHFVHFSATCIDRIIGTGMRGYVEKAVGNIAASFGLNSEFTDSPIQLSRAPEESGKDEKAYYKDAMAVLASSLKLQNKKLKRENGDLRARIDKQEAKSELQETKSTIKDLESKIATLTSEKFGKEKKVKDLTDENKKLSSKLSGYDDIITAKTKDAEEKAALAKEKDALVKERDAEIASIRKENETVKKENDAAKKALQKAVKDAEAERDTVKKKAVSMARVSDALVEDNKRITSAFNAEKEKNDNLKKQLDNAKSVVDETKKNAEKAESALTKVKNEYSTLQTSFNTLQADYDALQDKYDEAVKNTRDKLFEKADAPVITDNNNADAMKIHDLELTLTLYKQLYNDLLDRYGEVVY